MNTPPESNLSSFTVEKSMAKRKVRVNVRLIVSLGCAALAAGGGAVFLAKHRGVRNPQVYIVAGDAAFKDGDYQKAVDEWGAAAELMPQDSTIHVKLGNAYFKNRRPGNDAFDNCIAAFTKAADLDPRSKEAWEGLFTAEEEQVDAAEAHPNDANARQALPRVMTTAANAAAHLLQLDPNNVAAQAAGPILVVRTWILDLSMPETDEERDLPEDKRPKPEDKVDKAIAELTKLQSAHPEDEKIPYWIARTKIKQATQALRGDRPGDAPGLFAEAAAQFDPSLAAQPKLISLYLRKAEILQRLQSVDTSPGAAKNYRSACRDTLDQAQALADPKERFMYLSAKTQWAQLLSQTDLARGEAVYREVIKQFPDEVSVRLALAQLLQRDPTRRADALAVLDAIPAIPNDSTTTLIQRELWQQSVARAHILRAQIEISQLENTPAGKQRDVLIADIKASLDSGAKLYAGTDTLLREQGRFELATGDTVSAVKTLTLASDMFVAANGRPDFELLRLESHAYQLAGMNGKAIELLEKFAADPAIRDSVEYNNLMALLCLSDNDPVRAQPYVDFLVARFPDEPSIKSMEISALLPSGDMAKIKPIYQSLPEEKPGDIRSKLAIAQRLNDKDEQLRLLFKLNQTDPKDKGVSVGLAQALVSLDRKPDAMKVLDAADQQHPNDPDLKAVRDQLGATDRAEQADLAIADADRISDPFDRAVQKARIYGALQRPDDQVAQLKIAADLQPDNINAQQQLFIQLMNMGQFDKCKAMLPHLAQINADSCGGKLLECTLLLREQDIPNALARARELIHDHPEFGPVSEIYGEALMNNGQLELAAQQFIATLALDGTNVDARRLLIQCAVMQGKLEDAKGYIKEARQRYPDDPTYLEMAVQFEINWGDPELILPDLDKALAKQPQNRRIYLMTGDALLAAMRGRAAKADPSGAAAFLSRATDLFKTAVDKWPDDLRVVNGLSMMYEQNKDFDSSQKVLKAAGERPRWKDQPALLNLLADSYLRSGKVELAEPLLKHSLELNPQLARTRVLLAQCKLVQSQYEDALVILQPAISDFTVRQKYIDLLLELKHGDQAEVEMQDAIKAEPGNYDLTNLLLYVYFHEGRYDQGLRAANQALVANPNNMPAYYWRGMLEASGPKPDYDQALKDLGVYHDALKNNTDGLIQLAAVYDAKGDRDSAIQQYEAALILDPQSRGVRMALLQDYLTASPPRNLEAERLLTQTRALPNFAHDPDFEMKEAMILSTKDQPLAGVQLAQQAVKDSPDKTQLLRDYFIVLLNAKQWDLLLQETNAYTSDPKTSWYVFNARGMAWAAQQKYPEATADFKTALDRSGIETQSEPAKKIVAAICNMMNVPHGKTGVQNALDMITPRAENSVAWKLLAIELNIANKSDADALKLIDSALPMADSLPPDDRRELGRLASSLFLNANPPQTDRAMAMYQKMLQVDPNDVWALNDVASILTDYTVPGNPQEALKYSQRAYDIESIKLKPDPRILDTQGWVLIQLGRVEEGIDVLDKAIDQLDIPEVHYHLAVGYLRGKDPNPSEAQRQLVAAQALIQKATAGQNASIDASLPPKIEQAMKEADKMVKDRAAGI